MARHHRSRQTVMRTNARRAHANVQGGGQIKELISLIERRLTCTRSPDLLACIASAYVLPALRSTRPHASKFPLQAEYIGSWFALRNEVAPNPYKCMHTVSGSGSRLCIVLKINDETERHGKRGRERVGSFPTGKKRHRTLEIALEYIGTRRE